MGNRRELSHQLEREFRQVFRRMKREVHQVLREKMTDSEFVFLKYLATHDPRSPSELSAVLEVSASHVTQVTDSLVKKGWVRRYRSPVDKRVIKLEITPEGSEVFRRMEEKRMEYFHHKFNSFTTQELEILLRLFQKLSGN
ncbi:MarR family winged helix-turn-helix transcriptional regulator [Kroppenstedtia eburnea]|uniref:MarR family winged helix-turn-helix transcriptional regulator n=1 Tax=Kroppenstedtia eburnea TaxID=714067 RepID=UPI00020C6066|nr:MarR family transcriptional regulator [Desmospora sp. 8437]